MNTESFRRMVTEKSFPDKNERILAGLMFDHYEGIEKRIEGGKRVGSAEWVMDYQEIEVLGKEVLVVTALLPAIDEKERKIPNILATPTVLCIPREQLTDEQRDWFAEDKKASGELQEQRENLVKEMLRDKQKLKLYNFHGWGANPYAFIKPMAEMAVDFSGVAVLAGLMGSMKTTEKNQHPSKFKKEASYDWQDIRRQAMGVMYSAEGEEAFNEPNEEGEVKRIVVGHSMQGRTVIRLLVDELTKLPNTYFVSITPLMRGRESWIETGKRIGRQLINRKYKLGRHVRLGNDPVGMIMRAELSLGELLQYINYGAEEREKLLTLCHPIVEAVVGYYTRPNQPYGEELIDLVHKFEYIVNSWGIMLQTRVLDNANQTVGELTKVSMRQIADRLMLVTAGDDRVLGSHDVVELATELVRAMNKVITVNDLEGEGRLMMLDGGNPRVLRWMLFGTDNHYLREASWRSVRQELRSQFPGLGMDHI